MHNARTWLANKWGVGDQVFEHNKRNDKAHYTLNNNLNVKTHHNMAFFTRRIEGF